MINVYDATNTDDIERASEELRSALARNEEAVPDVVVATVPEIAPSADLIGIPESVYEQINAALKSGKRHIMLYGPPGTGKTQLAVEIANQLAEEHSLVTGSSDWTSQDLIGGYFPMAGQKFKFFPGLLLSNFDKPFIIDELNRCDIDKVLGPLFTVLAGKPSTLPYLSDPSNADSPHFVILPEYSPTKKDHEYSPTPSWRILATINSIDKASLYQMSYALMRRFAWVLIDVPTDLRAFVVEFAKRRNYGDAALDSPVLLADVWKATNGERKIGPAPIIDVMAFARSWKSDFDFFAQPDDEARQIYIAALSSFVFPMLDGITRPQADRLFEAMQKALTLADGSHLSVELHAKLYEVAI